MCRQTQNKSITHVSNIYTPQQIKQLQSNKAFSFVSVKFLHLFLCLFILPTNVSIHKRNAQVSYDSHLSNTVCNTSPCCAFSSPFSLQFIQICKTKLLLKASKTVQLQAANFVLSETANPILIHTSSLCS